MFYLFLFIRRKSPFAISHCSLFQVPGHGNSSLQFHGARRHSGYRRRLPHDTQRHRRPVHGQHADRPADARENATQTSVAAVSLHEDRHSADAGDGVRLAGPTVGLQRRLDRLQRGPLVAGHRRRVGRHLQLSGAQHIHENAETKSETAQQREPRQSGQNQTVQGPIEVGQPADADVGADAGRHLKRYTRRRNVINTHTTTHILHTYVYIE